MWRDKVYNGSTKFVSWPSKMWQQHASTIIKRIQKTDGEFAPVCAQLVLKCFYVARIWRTDILWTVSASARTAATFNKARTVKQRLSSTSTSRPFLGKVVLLETT